MKTMVVNHTEGIPAIQFAAMASSKATSLNEVVEWRFTFLHGPSLSGKTAKTK